MLSKARQKLIASLVQKKQRDIHGLFLAEGPRMIHDLIQSGLHPQFLVSTDQWTADAEISKKNPETIILTANEFKKISLLKTPQHVLGVFLKPENHFNNNAIKRGLTLVLDGIQDPGNLGTIIRLADWFGIGNIVCSIDTVDVYNPKVVQASMGALVKVTVHYTNLPAFLNTYGKSCKNPVYGAFLEGESIYTQTLSQDSIIIMGNEGNGIRPDVEKFITNKITIPDFSKAGKSAESLNVGVATAVICAEFRRQSISGT